MMKAYSSLLKVLGMLLLIPAGLIVVVLLGFMGFASDFSNASGGGSSMGYMLIFPLGFLAIFGWLIYVLSKRSSALKAKNQETTIRQQVYREQRLGTNTHDIIVNLLLQNGDMTIQELSQEIDIKQEELISLISELLQAGRIRQDVTQSPPKFYATP